MICRVPRFSVIGTESLAALVKKPFGEVKIFLFTGGLIKFHKSEFNLFMARDPVALARAELSHHVVGHLYADIEKIALAGHIVICHTRFYHVTRAVHFVLVHLGPAFVKSRESVIGVDIPIFFSCAAANLAIHSSHFASNARIRIVLKRICHAFKGLINIGIIEIDTGMRALLQCRVLEISDSSSLVLNLIDADPEGDILMVFKPWGPKIVNDLNFGEVDGGYFFFIVPAFFSPAHDTAATTTAVIAIIVVFFIFIITMRASPEPMPSMSGLLNDYS